MSAAIATTPPEVELRPAGLADHAFIFATWLRCYRRSSYFAKRIPDRLFYRYHHAIIERRPRSRLLIRRPTPGATMTLLLSRLRRPRGMTP